MHTISNIAVLGGGPAGLAVGYFAQKHNLDCTIYEAGTHIGGNFRTLQQGEFLFDTGAHRFHDKDAAVSKEIKDLLGDDLSIVQAPSEIFSCGRFVRFPLEFTNLIRQLDKKTLVKIIWENICSRSKKNKQIMTFADMAIYHYGPTLAKLYLLNYSKKLWGEEACKLSTDISGGRLKGLNLKSFIHTIMFKKIVNPSHLDGSFLYPKYGIGMISDKLGQFIGPESIRYGNRISRLVRIGKRISQIEINGETTLDVSTLVNTLPLTLSARILDPPPPADLLALVDTIRFRHLILCVFCLDRPSFSTNASLYFPEQDIPFTRLYEPKNRSMHMAPKNQTAVVLEVPCFNTDAVWTMGEDELQQLVWQGLQRVKALSKEEVLSYRAYQIPYAYPVLEAGFAEKVERLFTYFQTFENMHLIGRNASFSYVHFHDLFKAGKRLIEQLNASG